MNSQINPNSSGFKLKVTVLSLLIFFLLFHLWKIDFSRLRLLKCPHLQLTVCFNLCSPILPSKPCQISTWEPLSHTHWWSYQVSEILPLPRYHQKMRRLLLPSQRMLRGPSSSRRPSGQSTSHVFAGHLRAPTPVEDATGALAPPGRSQESSRVTTPGFPCLNALRKPGTKKENPGRRANLGRSRWKGGKYSHDKALTTATAHFLSLSQWWI